MSNYQDHEVGAAYVRSREIRLSKPEIWERIIANFQAFNPHLTLAQLSTMSFEELDELHSRILSLQKQRHE